jgi:hypothetical protein
LSCIPDSGGALKEGIKEGEYMLKRGGKTDKILMASQAI